jgi:hypothetical protein
MRRKNIFIYFIECQLLRDVYLQNHFNANMQIPKSEIEY